MNGKKKMTKPPQRNWISISVEMIVVLSLLQFYNPKFLYGNFYLIYFLFQWSLTFVYVLANTLHEKPDLELQKTLLKIKKIKIYESWYFLSALGLIFGIFVWGIFSNVDKILGTVVCGILYTFLFGWVRDILKHRREKKL